MRAMRWLGLGLLVGLCPLIPFSDAAGQDRGVAIDVPGEGGRVQRGLPDLPPQGAWGEVINVTSRWIVIQNHSGQQFPVDLEDIREFLVRWPYSFDRLNEQSWIEAVGQDAGSNIVRASHVDAFEGTDRSLVMPTLNSILPNNMTVTTVDPGFNRFMIGWDFAGQNLLYGWAYPVPPNLTGIPSRLHVVGNVLVRQGQHLRVGVPGNNFAEIVPEGPAAMTITQVTRGTSTFARKGDYAFMLPLELTPHGLVLSQLVLYKKVPLAQFNPNER